ncbi:MAG: HAD family phosphatase [Ginsengibacter sp.]
MEKIENIIFDLGGVLLDIDYNLTRKAFENLGVVNFDEMYSQANADKLFQNLETGKVSEEEFYKEFNHTTGLNLPEAKIRSAWNAMLLSFREKSLEYLEQLEGRYKIYLLSNTNQIHLNSFYEIFNQNKRKKSFEKYFEKAFYSFEIGLRKPDVECYEWVLNDLQIEPQKSLFIDDSINNIKGAEKAGLRTFHLTPEKKIENLGL